MLLKHEEATAILETPLLQWTAFHSEHETRNSLSTAQPVSTPLPDLPNNNPVTVSVIIQQRQNFKYRNEGKIFEEKDPRITDLQHFKRHKTQNFKRKN